MASNINVIIDNFTKKLSLEEKIEEKFWKTVCFKMDGNKITITWESINGGIKEWITFVSRNKKYQTNPALAMDSALRIETENILFRVKVNRIKQLLKNAGDNLSRPDYLKYGIGYDVLQTHTIIQNIAEEMGLNPENIYDSMGIYGFNHEIIKKAWFGSRAKNRGPFKLWVIKNMEKLKKEGRLDNYHSPSIPEPTKTMSYDVYKAYIKGSILIDELRINTSVKNKIRLGKINKHIARAILLENNIEEYKYCKINWDVYPKIRILSKIEFAEKYLTQYKGWWYLHKRIPLGLTAKELIAINLLDQLPNPILFTDKIRRKTLQKAVKSYSCITTEEKIAILKITALFRDIGRVNSWIKKFADLHDAGQFILPKTNNLEFWANFVLKYPEARYYLGRTKAVEKIYGLPKSWVEFKIWVSSLKYNSVSNLQVAELSSKYGLDEKEALDYEKFVEKTPTKKAESIPYIKIKKDMYTFEKLSHDDIEGLYLGLATDCCQHLHDAGSACAKAGYRDIESGFYVVKKGDKIVAQSWAWRGKKGELVFDSIEGLRKINKEAIADLYKQAAKQLIGKLSVTKVTVGDTEYGITSDIKDILDGVSCKSAKMIKKISYTDADDQWLLV